MKRLAGYALAAVAFAAALGAVLPARASVSAFFSAGTSCAGAASANFATGGAPVKVSLCVTTTAEPICGATVQLRSASAGEDGRFFVTDRVLGAAATDSSSPSITFPVAITNPAAGVDLGGTTSVAAPTPPSANVLVATFDLSPQANATNASYVVSLGGFSALATEPSNCLSGNAVDVPLAASFTLNRVAPPVITSASSTTFIVNTPNSFTVTATGSPAPTLSVSGGVPAGVTFTPATGVLGGSPALGTVGTYTFAINASNAGGTDTRIFTLTVIKADQTITFPAPPNQNYSPVPFGLGATATSGLGVSYTSTTPSVCSVTGASLTMLTAGTCSVDANQVGGANYNAAPTVTRTFTITAIAPGAPVIGAGTPSNGAATIAFTPPANYGGTPITGYTATCGAFTGTGTASPVVVGGLTNGTLYTCFVTATNAIGTGPASGTVDVTPTGAATTPVITSPAATTFTVTQAGSFTVVGTGNPAPTLALTGALPAGVTFTPATGVVAGTPALGTVGAYPLSISATNVSGIGSQAFTLTVQKSSQAITFAGPAGQPFSATPIALSATASSGLAVAFSSSTPTVCTVAGTSLTMVSAGTCTVSADQAGDANYTAAPTVTRSFAITSVAPGAPTITTIGAFSGAAVVNFNAPASNGGSPITSYAVTCNPGGFAATGTASPVRVTGLTNGTAYTCSVTATNASGTGPASAAVAVTPSLVTVFAGPSATGTGFITASLTGGGATCSFTTARFIPLTGDPASPPTGSAPPGIAFPHGLFDFALGGCTPGSTITMTMTYPIALPRGTVYWKYGPTPTSPAPRWYVLPSSLGSNVMTFTITDGGLGDDDLLVNGTIVDQGGPGVGGTGPGIPMLSPWALALLALAIALGMRRRLP